MKRYINTALLYAVLAMAGGVFYREFTKLNGYTDPTALSVVHTHYFLLGMVFFLLLLLLEKKLFLYRSTHRPDTGCLSCRAEPHRCAAGSARCNPGAGDDALPGCGCGHLRFGRGRAYPARRQPGPAASADQAQRSVRAQMMKAYIPQIAEIRQSKRADTE